MTIEEQLVHEIKSQYKSVRNFALSHEINYSQLTSALKRGIAGAGVEAMLTVFDALGLDIESVRTGHLVKKGDASYHIKQKSATSKADTADGIANRYKKLDEHGKMVVCAVVSEEERRMQALQKPEPEDNVIHIHWNDQPASAGEGFDLSDEHMEDWLVRYNELTRKADFCLNIQGHSMEPKFHDGDIALIRQQPSVDVGEIGLFVVDGKGYIKKQGPDRLISLNPDYDDVWPGEFSDAQCVGKVIGVLDPDWIVER